MTKAPRKPDSRAKALAAMNRETLIKTVKALDRRQTQLLNELAKLKSAPTTEVMFYTGEQQLPDPRTVFSPDVTHKAELKAIAGMTEAGIRKATAFPWDEALPNAFRIEQDGTEGK